MEKNSLSFEERMKERKRIISEINTSESKLEKIKKKINDLEKQLENSKREKTELENKIINLKQEKLKNGIPVPEIGEFEIKNGLPEMKRDINLKLVYYLDENKIREVFFYFILFNLILLI
jgi:septal ring factor EnvC (AmiA/AmiB activator)